MRGLEIADAANKLPRHMGIESFKASDGWLWRFRNRLGVGNKVERGKSGSADISAAEPFRLKFIIIIIIIFTYYFSREHIVISLKKRCEHRIRENQQIKSTVHNAK